MPRIFTALAIAVAFLPAWASNPGEPLDCSDWVFLEPGYSCTPVLPIPCNSPFCSGSSADDSSPGVPRAVDSSGNLLLVRRAWQLDDCGTGGLSRRRTEIMRLDTAGTEHVVAYLEDRCNGSGPYLEYLAPFNAAIDPIDWWKAYSGFVHFSPSDGRLLIAFRSDCRSTNGSCPTPYGGGMWLAAFSGFTTTFEILQTYTPPSGPISFRVPYMPEGFAAAAWFDTYYGDLATVGDWSQAQPLSCGYPASPPSVGDYLTVADPLPAPSPGQGRYYVTAVSYNGERWEGHAHERERPDRSGCDDRNHSTNQRGSSHLHMK